MKKTEEKTPNPEDSPSWLGGCWAGMRKRAPFVKDGGDELDSDGKGSLKQDSDPGQLKDGKGEGEEGEEGRINDAEEAERQKARKDKYMNAASKLRVDQVIEQTQTNATLDFDYLAYLVISCAHPPPRKRRCMYVAPKDRGRASSRLSESARKSTHSFMALGRA